MRSLAFTFSLQTEKEDILNEPTNNLAYPTCKVHGICTDCTVCCSCTLKTFIEIHLLSERNYVRDNYIAVSNIVNGLMRKLAYQNELRKKRKEAEENKKKAEELKYENEKKNEIKETVNWPDDLIELANDWDNLPENQGENVSFIKSITDSDIEELSRCNKLLKLNRIISKISERINKRQNESVNDNLVMRSTSENYHQG